MNTCVLGLNYGDEAKGKFTDILVEDYEINVRFNGGANAGHTVLVDGQKFKFHHLPSGAARRGKTLILANGMVINPITLEKEIRDLQTIIRRPDISISGNAHCVMPWHLSSDVKKGGVVGTTGRGIGPCYADKMHRSHAIRMQDLSTKLEEEKTKRFFASDAALHGNGLWEQYRKASLFLSRYIRDTPSFLQDAVADKRSILFECAHGMMLDIDFGTYPFVTSSGCGPAAIPQGCGLPNVSFDRIVGITKCYSTRVGSGPFPTEIQDTEIANRIREKGNEYGTTTGRPRRIGWLDLDTLRYSIRMSGTTEIAMSHVDTLSGFEKIFIKIDGELMEVQGWTNHKDKALEKYKSMIETATGRKITMMGFGPERADTVFCGNGEFN